MTWVHVGHRFQSCRKRVTYYANDGNSNFNALLLELKHEFANSFWLTPNIAGATA